MKRFTRGSMVLLAAATTLIAGACAAGGGGYSNPAPLAIFSPSISTGANPLAVTFDATAANDPGGSIVSYAWDFGDFTTGSGMIASHTFPAGQFTVTLLVTDNGGATGSSSTVITSTGAPTTYPTGLQKVGAGCCDTFGDFSWNPVAGATQYQVRMQSYFGGGCLTDAAGTFSAPASSGRITQLGLCLGSHYNTSIRYFTNGAWGPWSPSINITL